MRNKSQKVLLGLRVNAPAKGMWFVLRGRVLKGESVADAFRRLLKLELNFEFNDVIVRGLGLYEYFYADSCFDSSITTHYI